MNTALYGLQNTYAILAQNSKDGKISLTDITNPSTDVLQQLGYNTSFAQYLSSNFSAALINPKLPSLIKSGNDSP